MAFVKLLNRGSPRRVKFFREELLADRIKGRLEFVEFGTDLNDCQSSFARVCRVSAQDDRQPVCEWQSGNPKQPRGDLF